MAIKYNVILELNYFFLILKEKNYTDDRLKKAPHLKTVGKVTDQNK